MNLWFECKVKYQKNDEGGREKNVRESYLVDAVSFTDAEKIINKKLEEYISGEFMVTNINKSTLSDVFPFEDGDYWYKVKIEYVSVDESSGKEKKLSNTMLIQAEELKEAIERTEKSLETMIVPYTIKSVIESPIIEIFPYFENTEEEIPDNLTPLSEIKNEEFE